MRYLIGIGNYTATDDSIGLRVAEEIAARGLDVDFRAIDLGGTLLDIVHYLGADTEQVLVVDSARMGLEAGEFAFFTPEQVVTRKQLAGVSTHEGDLMKVLAVANSLGEPLAPITVLGIEPASVDPGMDLSPVLAERLEEYVKAAVEFFARA